MNLTKIFLMLTIAFSVFSSTAWAMMEDSSDIQERMTLRVKQIVPIQAVNLEESLQKRKKPPELVFSLDDICSTNRRITQALLPSWESYFISPIKTVVKMAYDAINFTIRNPRAATIIVLAYSVAAVEAGCHCYCTANGWYTPQGYAGVYPDPYSCRNRCNQINLYYFDCSDYKKEL